MSWRATAWARETKKHRTVGEKFLLLVLADYADAETCIAWPSQTKLAEICMMTDRSVRSALSRLESNGYVTRLNKGNQYRKSQYFLHVDSKSALEIVSASSAPEEFSGAKVNRKTDASEPENGDIAYKEVLTVSEPPSKKDTKNKNADVDEAPTIRAPKPAWDYPKWWEPLTHLEGYRNGHHTKTAQVIELTCSRAGVKIEDVIAGFCDYWPVGQIQHGWKEPPKALRNSINVQVSKVTRGKSNDRRNGTPGHGQFPDKDLDGLDRFS